MPVLEWALLAQSHAIDRQTNILSIFNQIDEITVGAEATPGSLVAPSFSFVSLWSRSDVERPEIGELRIFVVDGNGKRVGETTSQIDLKEYLRSRCIFGIPALPFSGPGTYFFDVQVKRGASWKSVKKVPLVVKQAQASAP